MAEGGNVTLGLGFDASGVIVQYAAVKLLDAMTVQAVAAEGDLWIGIAQVPVSAAEILQGKGAQVAMEGISLVKVGTGGVTFGTIVVSDGAGLAVATNTGGRPLGIALVTGVAGDLIPVRLTPGLPLAP